MSKHAAHPPPRRGGGGGGFGPAKPSAERKQTAREAFEVRQKTGRLQQEEESTRSAVAAQALTGIDKIGRACLVCNFEALVEAWPRMALAAEEAAARGALRHALEAQVQLAQQVADARAQALLEKQKRSDPAAATAGLKHKAGSHHTASSSATHDAAQRTKQQSVPKTVRRTVVHANTDLEEELQQQCFTSDGKLVDLRAKATAEMKLLADGIAQLEAEMQTKEAAGNASKLTRLMAERAGKRKELERLVRLEAQWQERDRLEAERAERVRQLNLKQKSSPEGAGWLLRSSSRITVKSMAHALPAMLLDIDMGSEMTSAGPKPAASAVPSLEASPPGLPAILVRCEHPEISPQLCSRSTEFAGEYSSRECSPQFLTQFPLDGAVSSHISRRSSSSGFNGDGLPSIAGGTVGASGSAQQRHHAKSSSLPSPCPNIAEGSSPSASSSFSSLTSLPQLKGSAGFSASSPPLLSNRARQQQAILLQAADV